MPESYQHVVVLQLVTLAVPKPELHQPALLLQLGS